MKAALFILPPVSWYSQIVFQSLIEFPDYRPFPDHPGFNRLEFADREGKMSFSIPLLAASRKGNFSEVRISYQNNWHKQLFNALKTSYGRSPFFEYYDYQLEAILMNKEESLLELNIALMRWSLNALKLRPEIRIGESTEFSLPDERPESSKFYHQVFEDRNAFVPGLSIVDLIFNLGMESGIFIQNL